MRPPAVSDDNNDEETPLLSQGRDGPPHKPTTTPLPTSQVAVLLLPWIAESIVSQSISPYINQVSGAFPAYETSAFIRI
jgi:hypothetical protein